MVGFKREPAPFQWLCIVLYILAAIIVIRSSVPLPADLDVLPIAFWIAIGLIAVALPVQFPGGVRMHAIMAPLLAVLFDTNLPNPFALCWIAILGTIELRDIRREIPWYMTLGNKCLWLIPTYLAWIVLDAIRMGTTAADPQVALLQIVLVGGTFFMVNAALAVLGVSLRNQNPFSRVLGMTYRSVPLPVLSQVTLGWLMAQIANAVGYWAVPMFLIPLLLARYALSKFTETREIFFGSVSALSQAIDAKDGFTRGHADRVSRIAGAIAREIRLSERQVEQIELAGLLHDIGKIGVEDRVLMKPARLDAEEQELMRRHPVYGASILEPSNALRPLIPYVLHHHENYDGSGYPAGLKGEDIPLGSRVIIVADAYEAMTSDRIYRKAIGHEKAMEQLQKYKSIQFDPAVVRALEQVILKRGAAAFEVSSLPTINYETLADLRKRLAEKPLPPDDVRVTG